jgi:alpha-tubulin suppressor-like RCC1 family protein
MKDSWGWVRRTAGIACVLALSACGGADDAQRLSRSGDARSAETVAPASAASADRSQALFARGAELNASDLAKAGAEPVQTKRSAAISAHAVYRFYNTGTGAHFFTASAQERDRVRSTMPHMSYDGPAFFAAASTEAGMTPVWRFYNRQTGVHFYTISDAEKAHVEANLSQFQLDGPAYRASLVPGLGLMPLYRFYLTSKGYHFYTASEEEADRIKATLPIYQYEGVAYYVPNPSPSALVVSPSMNAALPWNTPTAVTVALSGPFGAPVSATLSCSSSDSAKAEVLADCSRITAWRFDARGVVTVSGGGVSAPLTLSTRPQRLWSGHGQSMDWGSVVTADGRALVWGGNDYGRLGQGATWALDRVQYHPIAVRSATGSAVQNRIVQISGGESGAVALLTDGTVLTWGENRCTAGINEPYVDSALPRVVRNMNNTGPLTHVVQVARGSRHVVALLDDGRVMTWGSPAAPGYAQSEHCLPALVRMPDNLTPLRNVVSVATGAYHTLALTQDGRVYAWGNGNFRGNHGTGASDPSFGTSNRSTEIRTVKKADGSDLTGVVQIAPGSRTSMALDAAGQVWVWGQGGHLPRLPLDVSPSQGATDSPHALPVPGLGLATMVATADFVSYALDSNGSVWSWSQYGTSGELGDGPDRPRSSANTSRVPALVGSEAGASMPQSGVWSIRAYEHGGAALLSDGRLLNWGHNFRGQLAQGTANPLLVDGVFFQSSLPVAVRNEANNGPLVLNLLAYENLRYHGR